MTCSDKKLFLDTESCGLHGMPVLFQYAVDGGDIVLYDVWKEPIGKTLDLIEWMLGHTIVGFNLAFDMFQLAKCYTTFRLCPRNWIPEDHIDEIAAKEVEAQEGPCIKPVNCLDLLLHSRKGQYQSLMAREDVRIRRVPTPLAYALAEELEQRVEIDGIYFARRADKDAPRWQVFDIQRKDGSIHPDLKDVCLRFSPAGGLKFLAEHALKLETKFHFKDIELDRRHWPKELGYAPYAKAVSRAAKCWAVFKTNKKGQREVVGYAWPGVIRKHIEHWATNANAREYARLDIVYTRALYEHFGRPAAGDNDSVLACMVAVVRWRGFAINRKGMRALLRQAQAVVDNAPCNINRPPAVRRYIYECMDENEQLVLQESTKKANLIVVSKWVVDGPEPCEKCGQSGTFDGGPCKRCDGTGTMQPRGSASKKHGNHPAAIRAYNILSVKFASKEVEMYKKLLRARKFHASFNVIGALSSRMSGADGLNAQGIQKTKEVRGMFTLAPDGYVLSIGDFSSFEVTLADAVYNDPDLRRALLAGKKLHGLIGMAMFPGNSYEDVLASDGTDNDMYSRGKSGTFALTYGGDWSTLVRNIGISEAVAKDTFKQFGEWFPGVIKARERTFNSFCSMRQPDGTNVIWAEPAEYCETFLGFRRYFLLENRITRALFELAKKPPKQWRDCKIKVQRSAHKGFQTAAGAVASALYGAAFSLQSANQRAAANHEIQSPGAEITKAVQRRVWDLQPYGVHELLVMPANVHDEIIVVNKPEITEQVAETIYAGVEAFRDRVPLLRIDWVKHAQSWAGKKG